jgi:hypothetical protein
MHIFNFPEGYFNTPPLRCWGVLVGKVNMVMYQHEWTDGFFHRYSYDAENGLTLVETSRDSLVWEKEVVRLFLLN